MPYHTIQSVNFENDMLLLVVDHVQYHIDLGSVSEKLKNASDIERNMYTISPSGYGIHWPVIDEDLSIDGLIGVKHSSNVESSSVE